MGITLQYMDYTLYDFVIKAKTVVSRYNVDIIIELTDKFI